MARDDRDCNHHQDPRMNKVQCSAHIGQVTHRGEHRQRRQHAHA